MDSDKPVISANTRLEPLASGRFSGREAFEQLVRAALDRAASEGWKEIILSDASFEDWPLHERSVLESLHAWSKMGRRVTMLATRYDEVIQSMHVLCPGEKHGGISSIAGFVVWRSPLICPAPSGVVTGSCIDWTQNAVLAFAGMTRNGAFNSRSF